MRYRILVPYLIQWIVPIIPGKPEAGFLISYFLYYQFSVAFSLITNYVFIRFWHSRKLAMTGVLIMAVSLFVGFGDGYFQPWSILEIGLFTIGLIAIYKEKEAALAVIIVLAALNRETGVFLCLTYLLIHLKTHHPFINARHLIWSMVYFAIWGIVFFGLRLWLGSAPQLSLSEIMQRNLTPSGLVMAVVNIFLFLGALWIQVFHGFKTTPDFVRKAWRAVPVYIAFFLVFGIWQEVRLLSTLYPILLVTLLNQWETV